MNGTVRPHAGARRAGEIITIAVWSALLTGLAHTASIGVGLLRDRVVFSSRDTVWMAPLFYLVVFLVPAALLSLAAAVSPRLVPLRFAVFGYVAFGVFCFMLPYTEIARYAAALLAAGLGMQMARVVGGAPERWLLRLRRQTVALAGIVALGAAVVRLWPPLGERLTRARLPDAPSGAPNVLVIILDTVRAANLSLYGYGRATTPALDRRAAESMVFDRAFSVGPWTLPSHASMFTGRYASELSTDWMQALDDEHPTLAEAFAARGYVTGGFVANLQYTSFDSGLDRGFQHYDDFGVSGRQIMLSTALGQTRIFRGLLRSRSFADAARAVRAFDWDVPPKLTTGRKFADQLSREFLDWQAGAPRRPFFAFLNYFDAHQPVHAPPAFRQRFSGPSPAVNGYDAAIAYLDSELAALFDELARRGVLDETIVVVTSDHGELWGEHTLFGHAHNLYLPVLQVPLLVRYPAKLPGGSRLSAPVSLRDLAATIADLAGLPDRGGFPGSSLAHLATDSTAPRSAAIAHVSRAPNVDAKLPTSRGSMRSLIEGRMHYIRHDGDGREELFDYASDPGELVDLAATVDGRRLLDRYRAATTAPAAVERAAAPRSRR